MIAQTYNVSLNALIQANNLANPNLLEVGQVLNLPTAPALTTPAFKILPDSRLVRAPGVNQFDLAGFIGAQGGYIRQATDVVTTRLGNGAGFDELLTSAQVVARVSLEYSVDPRLLLAVLEFRAGWLSNPAPRDDLRVYPIVPMSEGIERRGLYRQLAYTANELNRAYYGWKGRGLRTIELADGTRLTLNPQLNAATLAIQYFLSLSKTTNSTVWTSEVSERGLYATYLRLFGDPFLGAIEPLVPPTLQQPILGLPFAQGETWYYTGGPHGGWGSGSAWASLDFAPPDERPVNGSFCYVSQTAVRAVAAGVIARAEGGAMVLDLDMDGDESTGWTIVYLHVDTTLKAGMRVNLGDPIGFASCAGGFSTATHLHIGRRFNGEWLPADCSACLQEYRTPDFVMGGWRAVGIQGQEYQGYLEREGTRQQAEQGRQTTINHVSW
jgi:murein DD-endopeptidase MepM/ murein hydrolase activator NlpD